MYAIVKTGGKQYRVEQGQSLLVERLPVEDGGQAVLQPLLYVDGSNVVDGDGLANVSVQARVVAHERGPKLRVVKFKPKRGYKRRTGHRQELTRLEVTEIKLAGRRPASSRRSAKPVAAPEGGAPDAVETPAAPEAVEAPAKARRAKRAPAKPARAEDAPAEPARARRKPAAGKPEPEQPDGT